MPTRVLFTCPHAAGKSLVAATYFSAAATRLSVDIEINVAGPEPDEYNIPIVETALRRQGLPIAFHPQLITPDLVADADLVVSLGVDPGLFSNGTTVVSWVVPNISDDLGGSMNAIHECAEALAHEIAAAQQATTSPTVG